MPMKFHRWCFLDTEAWFDRKACDRSRHDEEFRFQVSERWEILFKDVEIDHIVTVIGKKFRSIVQENDLEWAVARSKAQGDTQCLNGASGRERIYSNDHGRRVGHGEN